MATIALDVVTPNGSVFHEDDCEIVVLQTKQGELGVMADIFNCYTAQNSVLRIKINGTFEYLAVTEGFAEIRPEQVTVLVQAGEFSKDIDSERAEAAKESGKLLKRFTG